MEVDSEVWEGGRKERGVSPAWRRRSRGRWASKITLREMALECEPIARTWS
jgi:hypothetical protein